MEKSAHYFVVGLFVTISIFCLVGFLIWLMGPQDEKDLAFYTVEFSDPISGLEEGSEVHYKGVKVGKVMKMHLDAQNTELVHVDIGVKKETPVRAHTKVVLQMQGITGLINMEMATKNGDMEPPERRAGLEYPVLYGQGSQIYKALDDLPVITNEVAEVSKKINGLVTRNSGNIDRFASEGLSQLTGASREIRGTASSMRKLSDKLKNNPSQIIYESASQGVEIAP